MKIQTAFFGGMVLLLSAPYASAHSLKLNSIVNGKESVELSVLTEGRSSFGLTESVEPEKIVEEDGFVWSKERVDGCQQIYDVDGNVIIPSSRGYGWGRYMPDWGMFSVWSRSDRRNAAGLPESYYGICLKDGTEIIPPVWFDCIYNTAVKKFRGKRTLNSMWEDIDLNNPVPHN